MAAYRMKYLIHDIKGDRIRTNHGWIGSNNSLTMTEIFGEDESLLKFETRQAADNFIKSTGTLYAQSWGVNEFHPLYNK